MKASLIIPTYNKLPRLKLAIASITGQNISPKRFEVIFVDDGSTDGTELFFKKNKLSFQYKYIKNENKGRASARNEAIKVSKNEILIFADDDVILHPAYIEEHLKEQERGLKIVHGRILNLSFLKFFEDPTQGIFYSGLKGEMTSPSLIGKCISEEDILNNFEQKLGSYNRTASFEQVIEMIMNDERSGADWLSFNGGNTSVPRCWLEEYGYFDEKFGKKWGCEDLELGYRLFKNKKEFYYSYTARNYHIAHYRAKYKEEHNESLSYFYRKHQNKSILCLQDYIEGKLKSQDFIDFILSDL